MQAIITKYIAPTNTRGSRVKATCERGSIVLSWDSGLDDGSNHRAACDALCARFDAEDVKKSRESQVESLRTPTTKTDACNTLARFIEDLRDEPTLMSRDGFSRVPALTDAAAAIRSVSADRAKIKALVEALETIADTVPVFGMNPHARMSDPDNVKVRWNVHAIAVSATTEATRICHQTGKDNAFHKRTGKPEAVCAGARSLQLKMFADMGVISAPTNEAWNAARERIGMKPQEILE